MGENNNQLGITGLDQNVVVIGEGQTCDSPWITVKSPNGNENWLYH